jgi:outer membrane protein
MPKNYKPPTRNLSMKKLIIIIFALIITQSSQFGFSQEIHRLDLETSIEIAKRQSNTMLLLMEQLDQAGYNLKATTSQYKTNVSMDFTLPQYTETIRQFEDSLGIYFTPIRQNMVSTNLTINQPLPTDGFLYLQSGVQNYIDYYADDRNSQITSRIGLRQPIEALFGFNNYKLYMKQAQLNYEMAMKRLKRQELDLVYIVSQSFYSVLSSQEAMNIAKMNLDRQQEAATIAKDKYDAGLIREVEALKMEVDLTDASNKFENARTSFADRMRQFKETIGIELADSAVIENQMEYTPLIVNPDVAVEKAMANRTEIRESQIQLDLQEMNIKRQKAAGRISGDILLNYNFIGVDKSNRSIPLGTTIDNTWQNLTGRPGSFGVGLTASVPIIDWGANKARVKSAESVLEQSQINMSMTKIGIEREIRSLVDQLHNSLRGLEVMEKSVIIAEKSYEIERQRYANGEIDSQSMALERERLNQAYTSKLTSYINYKLSLSDLMRKTFFDFEKGVEVGK